MCDEIKYRLASIYSPGMVKLYDSFSYEMGVGTRLLSRDLLTSFISSWFKLRGEDVDAITRYTIIIMDGRGKRIRGEFLTPLLEESKEKCLFLMM